MDKHQQPRDEEESDGTEEEDLEEIDDFESGPTVVKCSNRSTAITAWIGALGWTLLALWSIPKLFQGHVDWNRDWPIYVFFVLVMPVPAVVLLLSAILSTWRWKKFGESTFEIKDGTAVIGGRLNGLIRLSTPAEPTGDYVLELLCEESIQKRSGNKTRTVTKTLFEKKQTLPKSAHLPQVGIPVDFEIPADCLETGDSRSAGFIQWKLTLQFPASGVDFEANYPLWIEGPLPPNS
jgi:hypothetical protein